MRVGASEVDLVRVDFVEVDLVAPNRFNSPFLLTFPPVFVPTTNSAYVSDWDDSNVV